MAGHRLVALAAALLAAVVAVQGRSARGLGQEGDIIDAPWLAQLEYAPKHNQFSSFFNTCGGSIVDSTHIVSAAHCFNKDNAANPDGFVRVRVGATEKGVGGQTYTIKSIDMHPESNFGESGMYDLAVVTLNEPIQFDERVQPIALAKEAPAKGTVLAGGGWGLQKGGMFAENLVLYTMKKESDTRCQFDITNHDMTNDQSEALFCTKTVTGMPCNGDSGSGLWVPAQDGEPAQLVGVVQSGSPCSAKDEDFNLFVGLLNRKLRPFLSQFFDMSDMEVTGEKRIDPSEMFESL